MLTYDQTFVPSIEQSPRAAASAPAAAPRVVATAADLGLNRLSFILVVMQLATFALLAVLYARSNVTIAWRTALPGVIFLSGIGGAWLYLFVQPGRHRRTWVRAESLAVLFLIVSCGSIAATGQYLLLLQGRPLIDAYLASADRWLGVSVPRLVAWIMPHERLVGALHRAYFTLAPQMMLAIVGLGVVLRDRDRLWELAFHYHFCLLVTIMISGLFPAECAFTFYGFESLIDQGRFIRHFESLRAATFQTIRFDDLEGLVSFPSFHAAGALMVTWAFRGHRVWLLPLIVLNTLLICATFMTGAHYVVDVLATFVVFWLSTRIYRQLAHMTRLNCARPRNFVWAESDN